MTENATKISELIKLSKEIDQISFPEIVRLSTNYTVIPLDFQNEQDKTLIRQIKKSANHFISYYNRTQQRFRGDRINDIGKRIEEVFVEELKKTTIEPRLLSKSGYPDMKLIEKSNRITYLESKAVSKGWDSSLRSFYYTNGTKIDSDGRHLLIAWNIIEESAKYWKILDFKICDLSKLELNLKLEFNAGNNALYSEQMILPEFE
jgi:hypothetical protein